MRFVRLIVVAAVCFVGALPGANAAPARFWISESKTDPAPVAPTISAAIGRTRTLYIWGRPATDTNGAFRELESFSLDVVSLLGSTVTAEPPDPESQPFIDFIDGTFKVENPTLPNTQKRFQFTTDSYRDEEQGGPLLSELAAEDILNFDMPDAIKGLQGVSPFALPSAVGIGNNSDPYRFGSGSSAAWRVAEFSFKALESSGQNHLYLQIGFAGMRHANDGTGNPALSTQVSFGDDTTPVYTAGPDLSHRQTTLLGDTFDLQVNAVPFTPGDYDGDGTIGPGDYSNWRSSFGQTVTAADGADGNRNGVIDTGDYVFWRKLYGPGGGGSQLPGGAGGNVIASGAPEPTSAVLASILFLLMLIDLRLPRF